MLTIANSRSIVNDNRQAVELVQSPPTDIRRDAHKTRKIAFPLPSLLHKTTKMPPIRTPLRSISGNRPKGSEISPYMRGQVKGQARRGIL
jgi:hypothetical protein